MAERRQYHESVMVVTSGPFGGDLIKVEGALCPDGVRRTARRSHDGVADSFFSIPARVSVKGRTVSGYVTISKVWVDDGFVETIEFRPNADGKNRALVNPPPEDVPVTDKYHDAPDGAVIQFDDGFWYERHGSYWSHRDDLDPLDPEAGLDQMELAL